MNDTTNSKINPSDELNKAIAEQQKLAEKIEALRKETREAVTVLERMAARDGLCAGMTLDEIFAAQVDALVFRFSDDTQPYHFNAAFERLLRAADLLRDGAGQKRTLLTSANLPKIY